MSEEMTVFKTKQFQSFSQGALFHMSVENLSDKADEEEKIANLVKKGKWS